MAFVNPMYSVVSEGAESSLVTTNPLYEGQEDFYAPTNVEERSAADGDPGYGYLDMSPSDEPLAEESPRVDAQGYADVAADPADPTAEGEFETIRLQGGAADALPSVSAQPVYAEGDGHIYGDADDSNGAAPEYQAVHYSFADKERASSPSSAAQGYENEDPEDQPQAYEYLDQPECAGEAIYDAE